MSAGSARHPPATKVFPELHRPSVGSSEGHWKISQGFFLSEPEFTLQEEARWPSFQVDERHTVDVTVKRPMSGDAGDIQVTVRCDDPERPCGPADECW